MSPGVGTLVIGFGPSAFGAVLGLVAAGESPAVLSPRGAWPGAWDDPGSSSTSGLARKTSFGSSEMYRYPRAAGADFASSGPIPVSAVPGGLSTVWGSNIQVFSGMDLAPWGACASDMAAAYRAVLGEIAHQGAHDALSARFPWPAEFPGEQPVSSRVAAALERAGSSQCSGRALIGRARNATAPVGQGCIACGQCLDGCPEGVIFDAGPRLDALVTGRGLAALDGFATRIRPTSSGVEVDYVDRVSQEALCVAADRVVLAAGSIASAVLLSNSGLVPPRVLLDDTQVFYVPMVPRQAPDADGNAFTLAQIFVTGDASPGSPDFHLSIYESDESFSSRAEGIVGPLARLVPGRAYRQLMAGIGFVPAQDSGRIVIERAGSGTVVRTVVNPATRAAVKRSVKAASRALAGVGMHVIRPLAQISDVGASYHVGRLHAPGLDFIDHESGAVVGASRVYLADGGALPVVPTGPVTLTMMANAYRIGSKMNGGNSA